MLDRDYNLGAQKFPEQIELCGVCGRRVHRLPPDDSRSIVKSAAILNSAHRRLPAGDAMKPMARTDARWIHPLWITLLMAVSAGLTAGYTCVVPFAALGVAAAMTLPRREAVVCTIVVWLANQAAGFGLMGYPWTLNTIGWGAVMGVATLAGTLAAQWLLRSLQGLRSSTQTVTAFVVAFSVYQSILYAAAVTMLGGTAAFAPAIMAQVLAVNVVALGGLWCLSQLLTVAVWSYRRRVSASPARFA